MHAALNGLAGCVHARGRGAFAQLVAGGVLHQQRDEVTHLALVEPMVDAPDRLAYLWAGYGRGERLGQAGDDLRDGSALADMEFRGHEALSLPSLTTQALIQTGRDQSHGHDLCES